MKVDPQVLLKTRCELFGHRLNEAIVFLSLSFSVFVAVVPVSVVEVAYAFNVAVYVAAAAMANSFVGKFDFP